MRPRHLRIFYHTDSDGKESEAFDEVVGGRNTTG